MAKSVTLAARVDADLDAVILGIGDEWSPSLEETRPVVIDALRPVASDERVHVLQPQFFRRHDDALQMTHRHPCAFGVGIQGGVDSSRAR